MPWYFSGSGYSVRIFLRSSPCRGFATHWGCASGGRFALLPSNTLRWRSPTTLFSPRCKQPGFVAIRGVICHLQSCLLGQRVYASLPFVRRGHSRPRPEANDWCGVRDTLLHCISLLLCTEEPSQACPPMSVD